jgi:hypothetical protein
MTVLHSHPRKLGAAATIAALITFSSPAAAEPRSFSGEYIVSFIGLTVARSRFSTTIADEKFTVSGTVASAGFGRFFDDTSGTVSSSGGFAGNRTQPSLYRTDYTQNGKSTTTTLTFKNGTVTRNKTVPAPKPKRGNWIPVPPSDLEAVADPMSATLVKAAGLGEVCGRTVKVFDGEFRLDLTLKEVASGSKAINGSDVPTVTCRARVKPVSGYRKGRKSLEFLEHKSVILVTFAQLGTTGLYAPIHATVGTRIGTVSIRARNFASN